MYPPDLPEWLRASLDPVPTPRPAPGARLAAVLLPLIAGPEPALVFTRRADDLPRHAGEVSFPGGLQEEGDAGLAETALRESEEELGLEPAAVDVLGALAPVHTTVSGILVVPFVGMLAGRPAFTPNAGEIAQVLEFSLARLVEAEAEVEWPLGDHVYRGFAYELSGTTIWGVTGRILHGLIDVVRRKTS